MNTVTHEGVSGGEFMPEELLTQLESTRECFRVTGGIIGGRGEAEPVKIANYHAPMADFIGWETHRPHLLASEQMPTVEVTLEIGDRFRYAFDVGEEWFRIGRGAYLHIDERRIPVRLVSLDYQNDFSAYWIYRDAIDSE